MNVTFDRKSLLDALSVVGPIAKPHAVKPILSCVLFDVSKKTATLSATDLELSIQTHVDAVSVANSGRVAIPAEILARIVRELDAESVTLAVADGTCTIESDGAKFTIYALDAADMPVFPITDGDATFTVSGPELATIGKWVLPSAAKDTTRYAINGVMWEIADGVLTLVATDGRRMAFGRRAIVQAPADTVTAIVPSRAMRVILRTVADAETVGVWVTPTALRVSALGTTIVSGLVEGHFPAWRGILTDCGGEDVATVQADALAATLRRAAVFTGDESRGVRMDFRAGTLAISSRLPDRGEAAVDCPVGYDGPDVAVGFQPRFWLDLATRETGEMTISVGRGGNKPATIAAQGDLHAVIMPMALD